MRRDTLGFPTLSLFGIATYLFGFALLELIEPMLEPHHTISECGDLQLGGRGLRLPNLIGSDAGMGKLGFGLLTRVTLRDVLQHLLDVADGDGCGRRRAGLDRNDGVALGQVKRAGAEGSPAALSKPVALPVARVVVVVVGGDFSVACAVAGR